MAYLRMSIARWSIDLDTAEGEEAFKKIQDEGVAMFRRQPGFVRYRLMKADSRTTVAVAEWESEALGKPGAMNYRAWLAESGIQGKLKLETLDGAIVAAS